MISPTRTIVLASLMLLSVVGCSATNLNDLPPELRTASVVSTRGPGAPLGPKGRWAWMPGSKALLTSMQEDARWIEQELKQALIRGMDERGWRLGGSGAVGAELGFLVTTDRELSDASIASTFGLNPGLAGANTRYGKGTLIVELRRPGSPQALWRGAVQLIADPTQPKKIRQQRIQSGVQSVLRRLPIDG